MTAYVALFRGINVGGKHILPMQDLRDILGALGCENVRTYIQSGNAVFESSSEPTPKFLHVWFLADDPVDPDLGMLTELRTGNEEFTLGDGAFYLHAPDGIGRSKLAAKVDKCLGVQTTARNWNTVSKLLGFV